MIAIEISQRFQRYGAIFCLAALGVAAVVALCGERSINPLVFDPGTYFWLAQNMWELLFQRGFVPNYSDRWFPSFVARAIASITSQPASAETLRVYFEFQLILIFAGAGLLWGKIAEELKLSWRGACIGFCLLFLNFFGLKFMNWMRALTDAPTFLFSLGLLWAFLGNRVGWMLAFGAMGSFTFPGFNLMTAALLAFPRSAIEPLPTRPPLLARSNLLLAGAGAALFVCLSLWVISRFGWTVADGLPQTAIPALGPLSILLAAAYLFAAAYYLGAGQWWKQLWTTPRGRLILAATFLTVQLGVRAYLTRTGEFNQVERALCDPCDVYAWYLPVLVSRAIARPGEFLVAQMLYWGLTIPLLVALWPRVATKAHALGLGIIIVVTLGVVLGFDKQGRHATQAFPFLVVLLAWAADELRPSAWWIAILATFNVALSHFWYPMNRPGAQFGEPWQQIDTEYAIRGILHAHPWWVDGKLYVSMLVVLAAVAIVCRVFVVNGDGEARARSP